MLSSWKACCSTVPQRWIFVFMAFLAVWLCNALRVILSITITEMVVSVTEDVSHNDQTCPSVVEELPKNHTLSSGSVYDWNEYTQGVILSSYFWGYAVTQLPMGAISDRYGGKYVMGLGILIPSIVSFITPISTEWGDSVALVVLRVIMGMSSGGIYPAASNMLSHWSTLSERIFFSSFVYAGGSLGTVFGTLLPALMIKYLPGGWPSVFHYFGIMGMLWFLLWITLCYNRPREHPFISNSELCRLEQDRDQREIINSPPWGHILSSKQFWAFAVGSIGLDWGYYTLTNDLPKYMSSVVKFSLESNGYLSALPYLSMWLSIMVNSWIANQVLSRNWLSRTNTRKVFSTISLLGPATFILGASFAGCDKLLVVLMLVIGMALMGSAYPSLFVNPLDLSPNYSGTLMAIGNGLAAIGGIFAPYVVGILTPNQTIEEWRLVFYIVAAVSLVCSVYILMYTSAKVQKWDDPDYIKNKNKPDDSEGT